MAGQWVSPITRTFKRYHQIEHAVPIRFHCCYTCAYSNNTGMPTAATVLCSVCQQRNGCSCKRVRQQRAQQASGKKNPYQRGYGRRWQRARLLYLGNNPTCVTCKDQGKLTAAGVVDHIIPHRDDRVLFWDVSNWQALCTRCHNRKSALGQ